MAARVLLRKLHFLQRLLSNEETISHHFFKNLSNKDVHLQLIEGCLFLESHLGFEGLSNDVQKGYISAPELKESSFAKIERTFLK